MDRGVDLKGIGVSPGIALGRVLLLKKTEYKIEKRQIVDVGKEKSKFLHAIEQSIQELGFIKGKAIKTLGKDKAAILDAQILMLKDPEIVLKTVETIEKEKINSEYAFNRTASEYIVVLENLESEYMRERASDIRDILERVIRNLLGIKKVELSNLEKETVLVAHDLTPSETATMDKEKVIGFLTNIGGKTSHSAIMAKTLGIPAVVGLGNVTQLLSDGDFVVLDGAKGELFIEPSEEIIKEYTKIKKEQERVKSELMLFKECEGITSDGKKIEIFGNIGRPEDVAFLLQNGAEGVGLYRTEFIFMDRKALPTEDDQFCAYKSVLEALKPKVVTIRTLDIGGDKELPYLNIGKEMNPFLGYRAIRFCLKNHEVFKTQLRALLRASVYGNLKIMFPMISSLEELLEAKKILAEEKKKLTEKGISISSEIEVGMMIEVPSAAVISDQLAKHVDFFSIGSNDLIQYTCAVDRMNEKIQHLYNPFNPAVLRLIKTVIDNGHKENIPVGMCGEMAGDKELIPLLIGMGLDELSMSASSVLAAKKLVKSSAYEKLKRRADGIANMGSVQEIKAYLDIRG